MAKSQHLVGFHVSAAGGIWPGVLEAAAAGAKAMAFFTRSSRTWTCPPLQQTDADKFKHLCKEHGFGPESLMPHGTYLSNLGCADPEVRARSLGGVIDEVQRCAMLGIHLYNWHPGSTGSGPGAISKEQCCANVADGINKVHAAVPGVTMVIENMAGQGGVIGASFEEIKAIIDGVADKSRVGVCIDTAHAHGAGYDMRSPASYAQMMADFDRIVGLAYLRGMHLNDSKVELGSRKDRHENIGKGHIGIECFRSIMNDDRLAGKPLILETPVNEENELGTYKQEISLLYALQGSKHGDPVPVIKLEHVAKPKHPTPSRKKKAAAKGAAAAADDDAADADGHDSAVEDGAGAGAGAGAASSSSSTSRKGSNPAAKGGRRPAHPEPMPAAGSSANGAGESAEDESGKKKRKRGAKAAAQPAADASIASQSASAAASSVASVAPSTAVAGAPKRPRKRTVTATQEDAMVEAAGAAASAGNMVGAADLSGLVGDAPVGIACATAVKGEGAASSSSPNAAGSSAGGKAKAGKQKPVGKEA